jgi:diadenosine tetraphosphate (Ap4A) HIT family hydrolase
MMAYDPDNIFAKILRGELPCKKVAESDHSLAFHDVNPKAPVHVLVVPKAGYVDYQDFMERASDPEIVDFFRLVDQVAKDMGVSDQGYRVVSNKGARAGQIIFHFHVHVFGGRPFGGLIRENDPLLRDAQSPAD